jgi:tRNA (adenine37-N6)-methyltransferase
MSISYNAIGYFNTPFKTIKGMPIQPSGAIGVRGSITILPEYLEGLVDLEGFSRVFVLYHLHEISGHELTVMPFLDTEYHGIFATRSPKRPNPVGLSVMALLGVEGNTLLLENVDVLDATPVIDIKPYVPDFDVWPAERMGWFDGKSSNAIHHRSDERFVSHLA